MENVIAKQILKILDMVDWLAYKKPRLIKRKRGAFLFITLIDKELSGEVIDGFVSIGRLFSCQTTFGYENNEIRVKYLLNDSI